MSAGAVDSSKPSVAFLIDRWDPQRGGAERAMAQFAEHLLARGYRVLAVACDHAGSAPCEVVRVSTFGITRSARVKRLARNLIAAARAHGADVTVGCRHLYECDLYWPHGGAHAVTLAQLRRARGLASDGPPHGRHRTFIELERELCERGGARKVACVSPMVMEELAVEWPACRERLVLVENGIDLARFHPGARVTTGAALRDQLGVDAARPLLLFVAQNPDLKGSRSLLIALASLIEFNERDWVALAVTPRPLVRPSAGARVLTPIGLRTILEPGRVLWRDRVDPVAAYSAADLCVVPTWRDTSGLVILEALACGVPVVTTRCAGASDRVNERSGAVLPDPSNPQALRAVLRAWIERVRAGDIDRAAIRRCVEHLDVRKTHQKLEALVIELAKDER
jgi:UDP-glucose:(heptosyl)LPS alpha-1,3-glucosyltransferase